MKWAHPPNIKRETQAPWPAFHVVSSLLTEMAWLKPESGLAISFEIVKIKSVEEIGKGIEVADICFIVTAFRLLN